MNLDNILEEYQATKLDPFASSNLIDRFPHGAKKFKAQLLELIEAKINDKDPEDLDFFLALAYWDGLDETYNAVLKKLALSTWHDYHEDIISAIDELKDDFFTEDVYKIAITPYPYRQYDDELESALRKCVRALKAINSDKAKEKLELLKATKNPNVLFVLEMYE